HNHGKIFYSQGLFFSTTLEVSYLRKNLINLNIVKYRDVAGGFKNLDFPWVSNPEIPIRFRGY
ncbi:TPA: hypothetical protein ACSC0U_001683, partial [Campylobacter jejuni]